MLPVASDPVAPNASSATPTGRFLRRRIHLDSEPTRRFMPTWNALNEIKAAGSTHDVFAGVIVRFTSLRAVISSSTILNGCRNQTWMVSR